MNPILLAVLIVAAIGLIAGVGLSVASIIMAVPKDEKAEALLGVLPGANCGACGFSGCSGYAEAMSKGEAEVGQCPVGGQACASACGEILGVSGTLEPKVAVIRCVGNNDVTDTKMVYDGLPSCAAAAQLSGGLANCRFGCLGLGDCVNACEFGGIDVCNGVAKIDTNKCVACGKCAKVCPKGLISILPKKTQAVVRCNNCDRGPATIKVCKVGCIGCGKCIKTCEEGAIKVVNFNAVIDPAKCIGCGKCVESCPRHIISMLEF